MGEDDQATWVSLAVSLAGVILAAAFLAQPAAPEPTTMKLLVWAVFSALCVLGAIATLFPHHCSASISLPEGLDPSRYTLLGGIRLVHGHHPTCGRFEGHEIKFRGKTLCAGCTGLAVGAIASISVATLHFVYGFQLPAISGYFGVGFVALGLLFIPLTGTRSAPLRMAINSLFVLGFGILLSAVDGVGNLIFDIIAIGLCVHWMSTRIQLSRWSHGVVCGGCDEPCEEKPGSGPSKIESLN